MNYISLYREFRPSNFDEVVGQDNIVKALETQINTRKIGHAYLFVGGRGTGKTTTARIFARELGIDEVDINEINAGHFRGINEVKEINEESRTLPFKSKYKMYILDEVHQLSKDASNAFLKTLEEPSSHVIFVLATTNEEKLLPTIVSRCQVMRFENPTQDNLKTVLSKIIKEKKLDLSKNIIDAIARVNSVSYRDAISTLERVIAEKDAGLTDEHILLSLNGGSVRKAASYYNAFINNDKRSMLEIIRDTDPSVLHDFFNLVVTVSEIGLLLRVGEKGTALSISEALTIMVQGEVADIGKAQSKHVLELIKISKDLNQTSVALRSALVIAHIWQDE